MIIYIIVVILKILFWKYQLNNKLYYQIDSTQEIYPIYKIINWNYYIKYKILSK